jgi:hypothetical protein
MVGFIEHLAEAGETVPGIVEVLNREHRARARGSRWHVTTVRRILKRREVA